MFGLKRIVENWVEENLKFKGFDKSGALVLEINDPSIKEMLRNRWIKEGGEGPIKIKISEM